MTDQNECDSDVKFMRQAIELARQGEGRVEPNPMVGCVVVEGDVILGTGCHQVFGGPHAEVNALRNLMDRNLSSATLYVTLEPCAHFGKTPPCVDMILQKRPRRVVVGTPDPFPQVAGEGIRRLRRAGIETAVGVLEEECRWLIAPFLMLTQNKRPWVTAKWAMTIDGRLATHSGSSKWITSTQAREHAHEVRSRVDGIMVGIGTALADDPTLTPHLLGKPFSRIATRIVLDSNCRLPDTSKLVQSTREGVAPTLVVCGPKAPCDRIQNLIAHGCEVIQFIQDDANSRLIELLKLLGERSVTNLLVDGGPRLVGQLFDLQLIDAIQVYIAPKLIGGHPTFAPNLGIGVNQVAEGAHLNVRDSQWLGQDWFLHAECLYAGISEPKKTTRTVGADAPSPPLKS